MGKLLDTLKVCLLKLFAKMEKQTINDQPHFLALQKMVDFCSTMFVISLFGSHAAIYLIVMCIMHRREFFETWRIRWVVNPTFWQIWNFEITKFAFKHSITYCIIEWILCYVHNI